MRIATLTSPGDGEQVHPREAVESGAAPSSRGRHSHGPQREWGPPELSSSQPSRPYVAALVLREDQGNKAVKPLFKL